MNHLSGQMKSWYIEYLTTFTVHSVQCLDRYTAGSIMHTLIMLKQ